MERLKNFYYLHGFDRATVTLEISPGTERSIKVEISEGKSYKMGNLFVVGASKPQQNLLNKLFPLPQNSDFNRNEIDKFKEDIENSAIFIEIQIEKIYKDQNWIDVLIRVTPDRSRYYGFRLGWEERKLGEDFLTELTQGFRGTVEYQERNIFNSYSSLSAIFQIGINEKRRLVVSYDTPYFFRNKIDSSFRIMREDEVYFSFKYNRFGIGESIIRRVSANSYLLASLNWYRTELTDLSITETEIDK